MAGEPAELTSDQNVKTLFTNSSSGQMFATTMTGAGTGLGGPDRARNRHPAKKKGTHRQTGAMPKQISTY